MGEWSNFFVAMVGAAAALTGLLFVALSINLDRILSIPKLANRGLESVVMLVTILVISSLGLVPAQPLNLLGIEILAIGIVAWLICTRLDVTMLRQTEKDYKKLYKVNIFISQLAILPYVICGISILCFGPAGLYWIVPAFILSFLKSLMDAWVLLIEINR